MGLIQHIKCNLGIHDFEELEFMVNKGQWNNVWTRATYDFQLKAMKWYKDILEIRAKMEGVEI